jgi:hypothetical protein
VAVSGSFFKNSYYRPYGAPIFRDAATRLQLSN